MAAAEIRTAAEERASVDGAGRVLSGYAAVFDSPTVIGGAWEEVVAPTAFDRALADVAEGRADVVLVLDHHAEKLLARTSSGTLRLSKDAHGLRFEADLPDTTLGRDVREMVMRGDFRGASFSFLPREHGETWQGGRRTLTDVELFDVSLVSTAPAYSDTSVAIRARQDRDKRRLFYEYLAL